MIKVLAVDDHNLARTGITRTLADIKGLQVVGQADCGEDCLKLAREPKPDVVLIDVKMPGTGSLEATRKLLCSQPDVKVMIVTVREEDPFPARLMQASAVGYMTKGAGLEGMVQAIRQVSAGQRHISPQIARQLAPKFFQPQQHDSLFDLLSERGIQIALMIVNCHKVQSIPNKLCLSPETVNTCRYRIFEKLSTTSDVEPASLAVRHGMVDAVSQMSAVFDASAFFATRNNRPGTYRMFDADVKLLYVGKAKSLKKRLASYLCKSGLAPKTAALVACIAQVETIITANETEALLLEQTLIKEWRSSYNILLQDDKSYPFVFLSSEDEYPRLFLHRGARKRKGRCFGPYLSAGVIHESLNLLQKAFLVHQCEDSYFRNRTRPCLQYQIKRRKRPCVGLVSSEEYAEDVCHSVMFLKGRSNALADEPNVGMEQVAVRLDFEKAAELRDQVVILR